MNKGRNTNFQFWWKFTMMGVILVFIVAQGDTIWDLHVYPFGRILPYFHRYDHANYARWGVMYLAHMNRLPVEVLQQFQKFLPASTAPQTAVPTVLPASTAPPTAVPTVLPRVHRAADSRTDRSSCVDRAADSRTDQRRSQDFFFLGGGPIFRDLRRPTIFGGGG